MRHIFIIYSLLVLDAKSNLDQTDKYFLCCNGATIKTSNQFWIEDARRQKIIELARYEVYITSQLHSFVDANGYRRDDGQRVRLYSKQGFTLDNIPLYTVRFYNEAIEIFIKSEKFLPEVHRQLKEKNYQVREINTCRFHFPFDPRIDSKNGYTRFLIWHKGKQIWAWGVTDHAGGDSSQVTLSGDSSNSNGHKTESTILHEYIHMCGYGSDYHNHPIFEYAKR